MKGYFGQQRAMGRAMGVAVEREKENRPHNPDRVMIERQQAEIEHLREINAQKSELINKLYAQIDGLNAQVKNYITAEEAARRSGDHISTVNRHLRGKVKNPRHFGIYNNGRWWVNAAKYPDPPKA